MAATDWIRDVRTLLFVPGDRPERFPTAASSGADGIVLDLEDGVPDHNKAAARAHVAAWLPGDHRAVVRVNGAGTPWQADDLDCLAATGGPVLAMVPKAEGADDVVAVVRRLPRGSAVVPIVESARGLLNVPEICAVPTVVRVAFGNGDLGRDLGVDPSDTHALHYARSVVVVACRAHGLPQPLDGITLSAKDTEAVGRDARHAVAMGFGGKMCIHPAQVAAVHEAFAPSADTVAWARKVVASADTSAPMLVDGQMIDKPIVERARHILARQKNSGKAER